MIKQAYERLTGIDSETVTKRRQICVVCNEHKVVGGIGKCNKCGCIISFKTAIGSSSCPLNKWLPHKETQS